MAGIIYELLASSTLLSLGLYHLICTARNFLKSPQNYSAKPFYPFPFSPNLRFKHIPLYLLMLCLFIGFLHQSFTSSEPHPLVKGRTPVYHFVTLNSAAVLFLFFLVSLSFLISETTSLLPFPPDLFFAFGSALFFLHYSVSDSAASVQTSDLQAKCDSVSARISALASLMCLILACQPKLFVAEVGLGAAICLQGLWVLQTGLSLYVDAFIPEGCHKLLDVVSGVEGSTKCELDESRLRAVAVLDLVFVVHVMFVVITVMVTYALVAKTVGTKRLASYEALPATAADNNHIQMKALSGTQA